MQSDLAQVIDAVVTEKLERLEAARFAKTKSPRTTVEDADTFTTRSRHLPAAVKRAVCARDGDQCTFVDENGRRCIESDYGKDRIDAFRCSSSNERVSEPSPVYSVRTELSSDWLAPPSRLMMKSDPATQPART